MRLCRRQGAGNRHAPGIKRGDLDHPQGAVPKNRLGGINLLFKFFDRFGTDVDPHPRSEIIPMLDDPPRCPLTQFVNNNRILRENNFHPFQFRAREDLFRLPDLSLFHQRPPDRDPPRLQKGVSHPAADRDGVHMLKKILNDADLVGNLRPAEHREERPLRLRHQFAQRPQLFLDQKTDPLLGHMTDHADRRGMRPVGGAEGVVDVDLRQLGEGSRKIRIVGLFLRMESEVLQQDDIPVPEIGGELPHRATGAILGEDHLAPENLRKP